MDIKVLDLSNFDINDIDDSTDIGETQDNIFFHNALYT